ncbi:sulfatase-like hydrolase/transferase [bacterium]|nr:sulfatase-like hydrolase/transferase [bacterium]
MPSPPSACAPSCVASAGSPFAGSRRVLLVDIDDVGYDLLRATPTPTLDWLETNGRFFTSFTTAAVCSPTRAMVNAGAYPSHPDVLVGRNVRYDDSFALPLAPLELLATVVSSAGFSTAKVGKWHLAPLTDPAHVLNAGWQQYRGSLSNIRTDNFSGTYLSFRKWTNTTEADVVGTYATTDESDDAIEFLEGNVNFVSLSYHAPHIPVHLPPAHLHSVSPTVTDFDRTRAMLAACDTEFGRVLRVAIAHGYQVIVFSDNGTSQAIGGQKKTLFEGGIVTPFWAYGPGIVPGRDNTRIGALDLYDTILDLFGIDSSLPNRGPQSRSFIRPLRGRPQFRRWAYSDLYGTNGVDPHLSAPPWPRTLRSPRFKLMRDQTNVGDRLYDLLADPGETINLLDVGPLDPVAQTAYDQLRIIFDSL